LAPWCDLRIAADGAVLGLLNPPKGLPCLDGGSVRLPRLVRHGRALELLLTGRRGPADEAVRIGLVNRLSPPGTFFRARVLTLAICSATCSWFTHDHPHTHVLRALCQRYRLMPVRRRRLMDRNPPRRAAFRFPALRVIKRVEACSNRQNGLACRAAGEAADDRG
jgi:enoyl-CoA hydratase/carnithine racemase